MDEAPDDALEHPNAKQLLEAVKMLSTQYEDNSQANRDLAVEFGRRKREARWVALGVVVVVVIAVCSWLVVRSNDQKVEAERRRHLADQIFTQRESQRDGCERQNDLRLTVVSVISLAVGGTAIPMPPGLPSELQELFLQSQERIQHLREQLLTLPGVQVVDCLAAYPPLPPP